MTQLIPDNPFDPEACHVPDPVRRLFDAIDNIQREYPGNGSDDSHSSFQTLCYEAVEIIAEISGSDFKYGQALSDHIDRVEEEAEERFKSNTRKEIKRITEEFSKQLLEAAK